MRACCMHTWHRKKTLNMLLHHFEYMLGSCTTKSEFSLRFPENDNVNAKD